MKVMLWNKEKEELEFIEGVKMVIPQTTTITIVFSDEVIIRFKTKEYSLESVWITK